jgi:hypothetical protein
LFYCPQFKKHRDIIIITIKLDKKMDELKIQGIKNNINKDGTILLKPENEKYWNDNEYINLAAETRPTIQTDINKILRAREAGDYDINGKNPYSVPFEDNDFNDESGYGDY